jgi:hypothetical protein
MSCSLADSAKLERLYRKHIGAGDFDISRLQAAVRRETRNAERGVIKVSPGLLRELRTDRATVGRLAKRCR